QVIVTGLTTAEGLVANPTNGHVFVATGGNNAVFDVDPIAKTKTLFVNASLDGLSLSPDNSILYGAATNGHILGFSLATKALVFDSGFIAGGVDGTAIGLGNLAGNIF